MHPPPGLVRGGLGELEKEGRTMVGCGGVVDECVVPSGSSGSLV